ncbi:SET domain-containing protein [Xylona heveae TC161]|uniref:SET domain-containing protein n=1 Tax=Xylona heveae (strain CBS 132557 / TC161) TaxID=1328760 RepID=A0A164ZKF0_XYLHT|nr:SET domain-containing protein [Xylona heveae TC161]KZF19202.1 SET domain-containing protein [Xylona heveae TC161]
MASLGHLEDLIQWVTENGGALHPSVELSTDGINGTCLVVRRDAEELSPGTCLVKCPHALSMSYLNATNSAHFRSHSLSFPEKFLKSFSPKIITTFFLCQQYLLHEKSFWWPYIRTIPQPSDRDALGTPMWFSDEDKVWLQGTNMEQGYLEREVIWRQEYDEVIRELQSEGWDTSGYTWELAKWAATILSSRSFISALLAEAISDQDRNDYARNFGSEMPSFPVLFPFADALNHRPLTKIEWQTGPTTLGLITDDEVLPGEQVYNNYGAKSNEELLLGYGFCLPSNPFDQFSLKLRLPNFGPISIIRPLLEASEHTSVTKDMIEGIYFVRGTNHFTKGYESSVPEYSAFPPELRAIFSILVANPDELNRMQANAAKNRFPTDGISGRMQLAVMNQLLMALRRKYAAIVQHDARLPQKPANACQEKAKVYRDGQIQILRETIGRLERRLKLATRSNEGGPGSEELLTLDNALQFLRHAWRDAYDDLKRLLKDTFGTANIRELREAGWEEGVWAIWLCAVRHQIEKRHINSVDGEQTSPYSSKLTGWLRGLDEAGALELSNAGHDPSEEEAVMELLGLVQSNEQPWLQGSLNADLVRWASRVVGDAGFKVLFDERDEEVGIQHVLYVGS